MVKAECIWCEDPVSTPKHGLLWIHRKCFQEITDCCCDIKVAIEFARGERPRIKANGDKEGYEALEKFLVEMQSFRAKWERAEALIKKLTVVTEQTPMKECVICQEKKHVDFEGYCQDCHDEIASRNVRNGCVDKDGGQK